MKNRETLPVYRAVHDQVFLPIFATDTPDWKKQAHACVEAGCQVIEITLRLSNATEVIEWFLNEYPDHYVLVGSTLEEDSVVEKMRSRFPQLRTLDELSALGVHGFVSMTGWSEQTLERFSEHHIVIPTSMTIREAFRQTAAGASFAKVFGNNLELVRMLAGAGCFGACPAMVTGGIGLDRIAQTIESGALLVAAGFELLVEEGSHEMTQDQWVRKIQTCLETAKKARRDRYPGILTNPDDSNSNWLESLPHYHPY